MKKTYQPIDLYKNEDDLYRDIALAYQEAIRTFYKTGCRYLQFDDTSWGEFCDPDKRKASKARGLDLDKIEKNYVKIINLALEAKPADMKITMHICRGNFNPPGSPSADTIRSLKSSSATATSTDSSLNTTPTAQAASNR